jgi:hypothetical protein
MNGWLPEEELCEGWYIGQALQSRIHVACVA